MSVLVCDALCGSGKTSACIRMMNERTDERFIFVTQFLSEVDRIKTSCPKRNFKSPEIDQNSGRTKLADIQRLLAEGANIATTHALLVNSTDEVKNLIRKGNYVLVLDESVEVLCVADIAQCDIDLLVSSNAIQDNDGEIAWIYGKDYEELDANARFREEALQAKSKNFLRFEDRYFFWAIPPGLFTCFREVYVLTYLFSAQSLRCFFDLHGIQYRHIGVKPTGKRQYDFCPIEEMPRARELRDKIHILDKNRLNEIGDKRTALSYSWYNRRKNRDEGGDIDRLRKNVTNAFVNVFGASSGDAMWTTFKEFREVLERRGFKNAFVVYNKRASNEYANRHYLAYCVNNFPRPLEVRYFSEHGVEVDGELYALSILVQWIFRSAIRNGEEIWIYIPSARMRSLLQQWLDNLADGRDLDPIKFVEPKKRKVKSVVVKGKRMKGEVE